MRRIIWKGADFCAAEEDGVLTEYLRTETEDHAGEILLGKVDRIMSALGCAFVDIGRKKAGFLPLKENSLSFAGEALKSGMRIPVQIRKEETGEKGAFLTRDLTLAGKTVILMPMNRYIGVSGRITEEGQKEALREIGREIADGSDEGCSADDGTGRRFGLVMRAAALEAEKDEIRAETEALQAVWHETEERCAKASRPGEILYHADAARQMISDYDSMGTEEIREAKTLPETLQRQLRAAENRKIPLDNGGNIVIDRCEAMTVIDVNTGHAGSGGKQGDLLTETNLAACGVIAAQIRLRNLGGMILIDFIDMEREEDRERVAEKMQEELRKDRRKTVVHGWTRLGILEMTRKRTGKG